MARFRPIFVRASTDVDDGWAVLDFPFTASGSRFHERFRGTAWDPCTLGWAEGLWCTPGAGWPAGETGPAQAVVDAAVVGDPRARDQLASGRLALALALWAKRHPGEEAAKPWLATGELEDGDGVRDPKVLSVKEVPRKVYAAARYAMLQAPPLPEVTLLVPHDDGHRLDQEVAALLKHQGWTATHQRDETGVGWRFTFTDAARPVVATVHVRPVRTLSQAVAAVYPPAAPAERPVTWAAAAVAAVLIASVGGALALGMTDAGAAFLEDLGAALADRDHRAEVEDTDGGEAAGAVRSPAGDEAGGAEATVGGHAAAKAVSSTQASVAPSTFGSAPSAGSSGGPALAVDPVAAVPAAVVPAGGVPAGAGSGPEGVAPSEPSTSAARPLRVAGSEGEGLANPFTEDKRARYEALLKQQEGQ